KPHKAPQSGELVLPAGVPLAAAQAFIERCHSVGTVELLRHYRGVFYCWAETHWREYDDETLERDLYSFLRPALVPDKKGNVGPYNPTQSKVREIVHALKRGCLVQRDWDQPCWLGENEYRPAANLIAGRNGILNLETRELQPHSPLFFTTNCVPLDYDPEAPK